MLRAAVVSAWAMKDRSVTTRMVRGQLSVADCSAVQPVLPRLQGSVPSRRQAPGSHGRVGAFRCGTGSPVVIGYLRGRAEDIAGLALQRQALAEAGCEQVIEDLAVGRWQEQPKLLRLFAGLEVDDVLVVPRMGTLGPSMAEVVRRVQYVAVAGAGLRSLEEEIDTTTEAGRAAVEVIGGLAQLGRSGVRKPPGVRSEATRTQGRKPGRKPKLTQQQRAFIVEKVLFGRETAAKMAQHHKVSEATISRVISAYRTKGDASGGGGFPSRTPVRARRSRTCCPCRLWTSGWPSLARQGRARLTPPRAWWSA